MVGPVRFALNHIAAPRQSLPGLMQTALALGIDAIELRNDLPGVAINDGTPPADVRDLSESQDIALASINALYPFDVWNDARAAQACRLADYAAECGAAGVVLCPLNEADSRDAATRAAQLRVALGALAEIFRARGVLGFVEPLGFATSALRRKRDAVTAIDAVGGGDVLHLVHDTFHHHLAGDDDMYPHRTGIVHISGVADAIPVAAMRDGHRGLIDAADRLGNIDQIRRLRAGGYRGCFSIEPFAADVQTHPDIVAALRRTIDFVNREVAAAPVPADVDVNNAGELTR
ncbi:MAG: TIM barrel protein [Janthinobacterium lividum]